MSEVNIKVTPKVLTVKLVALRGLPAAPTQEQINTAVTEYMDDHPESQIPDGSVSMSKLSSDVAENVSDVPNKADQIGSYPDLIAGTADNLLSSSYQTDKTPYILRRTPYGARERGSIVGGSIVWNQLNKISAIWWSDYKGVTFTKISDTTIEASGETTGVANARIYETPNIFPPNHVYLIDGFPSNINVRIGNAPGKVSPALFKPTVSTESTVVGFIYAGTDFGTGVEMTPQVFDLTLMFGTEIADYIYAQEQATAGAGVALAKAWAGITADYYPYDEGSIKSVEGLTSHKMTGFNQWDGETEVGAINMSTGLPSTSANNRRTKNFVPVMPNTTYCYTNLDAPTGIRLVFYDADQNKIGGVSNANQNPQTFTTPANAKYIKFYWGNISNVCISFSSSRNGQYEPYTAHTYPLDSSLTLRGIPALVDDHIEYDGDIYPPSGEVERKYYLIDMGVLNWKKSSSGNNYYANLGDGGGLYPKYAIGNAVGMMCARYIVVGSRSASPFYGGDKEMTYYYRATAQNPECEIYVHDESYTDVASFKSAMSGVYLVYERETPTTETAEPYTALQICDPNGTEEWVGANMPVGHETKYYADLKGKIEDIPDAPSADGTYTLRVTVSNGVATYSWE